MTASIPRAPMVSVVMAVKNGGQIIREAIDSILNQTFTDFEFIIINDGSTDETLEVLAEYSDPRIQVYSQENQGLARTLNRGLCLATGKYFARQDHDDISLSTRLEKQVAYFEAHPECGLLGTAAEIWDEKSHTGRFHHHPILTPVLNFELIFNNPFVHTSWMFRSNVISQVGYYSIDTLREPPEDYEYVSRIARECDVANLADVLTIYREMPNSLSSEIRPDQKNKIQTFKARLALISAENIAYWNTLKLDDPHALNFGALLHGAHDQYKEGSHFADFKRLIKSASRRISLKSGVEIDSRLVRQKIDSLRYKYLTSKNVKRIDKFWVALSFDGFLHLYRLFKNRLLRRIYERLTGPGPRREYVLSRFKAFLPRKK